MSCRCNVFIMDAWIPLTQDRHQIDCMVSFVHGGEPDLAVCLSRRPTGTVGTVDARYIADVGACGEPRLAVCMLLALTGTVGIADARQLADATHSPDTPQSNLMTRPGPSLSVIRKVLCGGSTSNANDGIVSRSPALRHRLM